MTEDERTDVKIVEDALSNLSYPYDAYAALNRIVAKLRWFETKYPGPYPEEVQEL